MNISRRWFVKSGFTTAVIAGLPLAWAAKTLGQKKRERISPTRPIDALSYYNKATFAAYANTDFLIQAGAAGILFMRLTQIEDLPGNEILHAPDECFGLTFLAPAGTWLPQHTYQVEHAALGTFPLFLVPVDRRTIDGPAYYQAVINRRSRPA